MEELSYQPKTRFYKDGKFIIVLVETETGFEAHLTRENYGDTDLMFGIPKTEKTTYEEFQEIVEGNLSIYERIYLEKILEKEGIA